MAMMLYRAREDRHDRLWYAGAGSLRSEDAASDIFPWPRVTDDRNPHDPGTTVSESLLVGYFESPHWGGRKCRR
jgi:gamma-glutamyltranspeptidase/glutathione hydrolase